MRAVTEAAALTIDEMDAKVERAVARQRKAGVAVWILWRGERRGHAVRQMGRGMRHVTFCGRIVKKDRVLRSWVGTAAGGPACVKCARRVRVLLGRA